MKKVKNAAIIIIVLIVITIIAICAYLIVHNTLFPNPSKAFDYSGWKKASLKKDVTIMIPMDWSVEIDSGICYIVNKNGAPEMISTFLSYNDFDPDHPNKLSNRFFTEYEAEIDYNALNYYTYAVSYGNGAIKLGTEEKQLYVINYEDFTFVVWDEGLAEDTIKQLAAGYYY